MLAIFFFYGLAFILMGVVLLSMPKRNDFLEISGDLWLMGLFGISHGINEWIDLFILMGGSVNTDTLRMVGAVLLPVSFFFMAAFGGRIISKRVKQLSYLKYAWIAIFAIWAALSITGSSIQASSIFARYLICLPGTIIAAAGLSIAATEYKNEKKPKIIYFSTQTAIMALIAYGALSGLITPRSDFFPASLLNYDNFTKYIGIPVQFFKMLLAIVITASFVCMTSIFQRTNGLTTVAGGIRKKTGFVIALTAAITLVVSMATIYIAGFFVIMKGVGHDRFEITRALSLTARENIEGEVEDMKTYAIRSLWKGACDKSNRKYAGMSSLQVKDVMLNIDKKWMSADSGEKLIAECVSGGISESMREIMQIRGTISEMFITDRFGGLVYSSGRTSDFYQADEDWWQKAFNGGKGATYFGSMEYDVSAGKWGSAIAVPIIGSDSEVIGVCKAFVQIEKLFDFLNKFKLRTTGHAFLVDDNGMILVHKGIAPLTTRIMTPDKFAKLKHAAEGFTIMGSGIEHEKKSVLAICPINSEILRSNGVKWDIMIAQDSGEALGLLNAFLLILFVVSLFFIPMTVPVGIFLGGKLAKPIDELSSAAAHIAAGELDRKIDIRTGDEIEQFAETFKVMIGHLKDNQEKLVTAKKELEGLSHNQEEILKKRTEDLTRAQEATLNILEDLVEARNRLEKYSKDLERALQVKSDFTSTVSHELRTPLAAIKEGIAIVFDGTSGEISDEQKEFLGIAKRNVDRLARLINDILDFQKLEAGKMIFNMAQNDINETVRDTAKAMRPIVEKKQLEFALDLNDNLPKIIFDKDKIHQVLTNLISNAVKYAENGSIRIRTALEGNAIRVSVVDAGPGIKPEDIPKLFTQFTQLENVSDRKTGSTGLGLSICKEIIAAHNGKIWAESEYGKGSNFSFMLPILDRRPKNA